MAAHTAALINKAKVEEPAPDPKPEPPMPVRYPKSGPVVPLDYDLQKS